MFEVVLKAFKRGNLKFKLGISSKIIFIFYIILIKLKDKSIAKVNKQREALISIKGLGKNRKNNKWRGDVYLEIKKK